MKQVIIHVGFHKTATTSIQQSCSMNRDKLAERGFYYPKFHLDQRLINNNFSINHSIPFYSLFTSEPEKYHINVRLGLDPNKVNKEYEQQLNQILEQKIEKIIISGEDICGLSQIELERMKKKISSYGYDIRIIVVIRSPLSSMTSSIQEIVKNGYTIEDIRYHQNPNILKTRIETIESVFPQTDFFPFQDLLQHKNGPVGFFWETIGVANFSNLEVFRTNNSISDQATRLIDFINKEQPFFLDIFKKKLNPLRRNRDTVPIHKLKGDRFQLNEHELNQFRDELDQANQYLLTKFNTSFCDKKAYCSLEQKDKIWSKEQIEQLKVIISELDDNIKIIAYDYFKNIICLDKEKLSYIFSKKIQKSRFLETLMKILGISAYDHK